MNKQKINKPHDINLLLIEDDDVCGLAEKNIFSTVAEHVDLVRSVEESKLVLAQKPYMLIVSDLSLSDGTGFDVIRWAKENKASKNSTTPFFALTSFINRKKQEEAQKSGFVDFLTKPISKELVSSIVEYYIKTQKNNIDKKNDNKEHSNILPIIDLELGKQRLHTDDEVPALMIIKKLIASFPDDLNKFAIADSMEASLAILHKIRGGVYYCGTPSLQYHLEISYFELEGGCDMTAQIAILDTLKREFELLKKEYQNLSSKESNDKS